MCVIVTRAGLHDLPETVCRRSVPASVELRPAQGFQHAARSRLGLGRALQQLRGGRRAAPAEQVEPAAVPRISVAVRGRRAGLHALILVGAGIVAGVRCF
jgi:hypothetical protein